MAEKGLFVAKETLFRTAFNYIRAILMSDINHPTRRPMKVHILLDYPLGVVGIELEFRISFFVTFMPIVAIKFRI